MAKITVEFDTKDKTMVVKKDDKKLSNVVDVSFYQSFDDEKVFRASVSQRVPDDDEGILVMTHIIANEDGEATETVEEVQPGEETAENLGKALFGRTAK